MKRLIVLFVAMSLLVGLKSTTAFANCEMPPIIKKSAIITMRYVKKKDVLAKILEIKKGSCWIYVNLSEDPKDCAWFNLNQVDIILYRGMEEDFEK